MKSFVTAMALLLFNVATAQTIRKIDGSALPVDSLESKINFLMREAGVPGLAVAVFNNNKPVYSHTFGLANVKEKVTFSPQSIMYAASFAKMVFAWIVMQLVEENILDLDRPLVNYLEKPLTSYEFKRKNRGYQDLVNDDRYKKITARMCLTHTTGFPNWRWFEPDNKLRFLFDPGTRYNYSGEGLYLLQFVIEQITGKDYETLSQQRVFGPVGMNHTSQLWQKSFEENLCYGHDANGEPVKPVKWTEANAAGSMNTSLEDFVKFYTAFINGNGLSAISFRNMTSRQIRIRSKRQFGPLSRVDGTDNDTIELGYGFGVGVLQSPYGRAFFKEGNDEGWQHYCIAFPDKKTAIVIMTNSNNGDSIFKDLLAYAIGDVYTPWQWENYIPYYQKNKK